jgi:hypothetical protein
MLPETTYKGQVAAFGSDAWTTVVEDCDAQYVSHCLGWQGYNLLRKRLTSTSTKGSERS